MQLPLSLKTLGQLDSGRSEAIIDAAIREAVADLDDRGDDGKARSVVIQLDFKRRANGLVETDVRAQAKIPPRTTASAVAKIQLHPEKGSRLLFEEYCNTDPDQKTFLDDPSEVKE